MNEMMMNFCYMIRKEMATHAEAEKLLDKLCCEYGTEVVAMWLVENDQKAIEWLERR